MANDQNRILVDSIKRLLRRRAFPNLRRIIAKTHAADLSIIFRSLPLDDQCTLFNMIPDISKKGILLSEMDEDVYLDLAEKISTDALAAIFESMPSDDVADLIELLPEEISDAVLKKMHKAGVEEVADLLSFADDTAGRIMTPDFIALKEEITAREAIASLQKEYSDVEMPFYLYVVDEYGKLTGVSSLRQLVVVPPNTPLRQFMATDVFSVKTDMDQEEVARLVARYDILAVPVVDENLRLVGIVTVDDVIDIIRTEATEDILKMAGVGEEYVETKSILKSTRIRLPWLFASCIGGIVALLIISHFESVLSQVAYLAAFIPVIMGMGGNIGTQSSTIVVRGLATGRLNVRDIWRVVSKGVVHRFDPRSRLRPLYCRSGPAVLQYHGSGHIRRAGVDEFHVYRCPGGVVCSHGHGAHQCGPGGGNRSFRDHGHRYHQCFLLLHYCHDTAGALAGMSRLTTTAIVLWRREYGDFDLIVTLLTRDQGKRTLIAKAAKKSTKRFPGILEPFNTLQIAFRQGQRKGMPVLEEATLSRPSGSIRSDFIKTAYASYWSECVGVWMEEGEVRPDIFNLLAYVLDALADKDLSPAMLSILFQMRFIGHEGLRPVLERCTCCQCDLEAIDQKLFCIDLGKGGVVCNQCPASHGGHLHLSRGTLKQLQWIADGDLAKALRARFTSFAMDEATRFLEAFVPYHIGKKLKSLTFLQGIRQ